MNILYISNLVGTKWSGPNKSVPNQIQAQAKYNNVLWYNVNTTPKDRWNVKVNFLNTFDVPSKKIEDLPNPFNNPDIVIFQGVYFWSYYKIATKLVRKKIPYIIIPRSSLTQAAQKSKKIKKQIANYLFFNRFIGKAAAIHYLTTEEYTQSGDKWNSNHFIIPNGEKKKNRTKTWVKNRSKLRGVFIGRLDIYQKGLDLLVRACAEIKDELENANVQLDIYGPDRNGSKKVINKWIEEYGLNNIIRIYDPIFDEEKEKILLDSDFFILTSRFEGHPMGLIEALSYGLPCLVTTGSNMAKDINEIDAGWTSSTEVTGICNSLSLLIKDKARIKIKGANALELSKRYDWDELAKDTKNKYNEIVQERSKM